MYKFILNVILFLIFALELSSNAGTLKGTIEARGVRSPDNIVIYIDKIEGEFQPPEKNPVLDQENLKFIPHVLPVLVGTTVDFPNNDIIRHNVFSPSNAKIFNLGTYSIGITREITFDKPGAVTLLCKVHAEMSSFIIVLENPYFTVSNSEGKFEIKDIPGGTYTIKTWHEKLKESKQKVTIMENGDISIEFKLNIKEKVMPKFYQK